MVKVKETFAFLPSDRRDFFRKALMFPEAFQVGHPLLDGPSMNSDASRAGEQGDVLTSRYVHFGIHCVPMQLCHTFPCPTGLDCPSHRLSSLGIDTLPWVSVLQCWGGCWSTEAIENRSLLSSPRYRCKVLRTSARNWCMHSVAGQIPFYGEQWYDVFPMLRCGSILFLC